MFIQFCLFLYADLLESRLQIAKNCGADYTIQITPKDDVNIVSKKIEEILGEKPDITIDCTGYENTVNIGLRVRDKLLSTHI